MIALPEQLINVWISISTNPNLHVISKKIDVFKINNFNLITRINLFAFNIWISTKVPIKLWEKIRNANLKGLLKEFKIKFMRERKFRYQFLIHIVGMMKERKITKRELLLNMVFLNAKRENLAFEDEESSLDVV